MICAPTGTILRPAARRPTGLSPAAYARSVRRLRDHLRFDPMSWDRTERTLRTLQQRSTDAQTPEQCQAVGQLARDAIISLAQAVFRPDVHWRSDEPVPSATDSKRQLEAYVAAAFSGGGKDEARSYVRSSVQLADALTHKRTATQTDARMAALAAESLVRLIALAEGHQLVGSEVDWHGVQVRNRYFAWDGPTLHALEDRPPIPVPLEAIEALQAAGHKPVFGTRAKLLQHQASGLSQVFETDRNSWRRELLQSDGQVLMVRPGAGSGAA